MMATEFAEAFEPFAHGRGSSSTMPQKRNPISSELIIAAGKVVFLYLPLKERQILATGSSPA